MIDALGNAQSLLLLGGTSDIGLAVVRRYAQGGRLARVVLAGRPGPALDEAAQQVRALGVPDVGTQALDAADIPSHAAAIAHIVEDGDIDVAVMAIGVLPDQARAARDSRYAAEVATINYVGPVSLGTEVANAMRRAGHGTLVVLSSIAGERPRVSNFVYGSTKAGLDSFASGLSDTVLGTGARVLVVRPGFVSSKMTTGYKPAPFATTTDAVAEAVFDGVRRRRQVVYAPGALRAVASVMRHLPRPVFRRLPG